MFLCVKTISTESAEHRDTFLSVPIRSYRQENYLKWKVSFVVEQSRSDRGIRSFGFQCHFLLSFLCSEDQQFLHEVVASVLNANGVGMFKKKRLRDLMVKEACRQNVVNKFLLEICDDRKSDVVCDVVS